MGDVERHFNGAVDNTTTTFVKQGTREEITQFLNTVCAKLSDLPMDRLEAEKQILRTEEAGKSSGFAGDLMLWRYGPQGRGLLGYPELGLNAVTADTVRSWAGHWFTRGNASLVIIGGSPPEGLRLTLPDGPRRPVVRSRAVLPFFPAFIPHQMAGIALHTEVERSSAASVFRHALQRRLHRALRTELALSYTTAVESIGDDGDFRHLLAYADGLVENQEKLASAFLEEVERMAAVFLPPDELEQAKDVQREMWDHREVAVGLAMSAASNELTGRPVLSLEEYKAETEAVTAEQVKTVAAQARDHALITAHPDAGPPRARYRAAPESSVFGVEGRVVFPMRGPTHLVSGPSGLTSVTGYDMATVLYRECVAVLAWPDGARRLFGPDGLVINVEPSLYRDDPGRLTYEIDQSVPRERFVPMPQRESVPREEPDGPPMSLVPPPLEWELRSRLPFRPRRMADDPELYAARPRVREGRLDLALSLLAANRGDHEGRSLRLSALSDDVTSDGLLQLRLQRPEDPELLLLLGATRISEAWRIRSDYQAQYVEREQFRRFWLALSQAGEPLYRAAELLPGDPNPWNQLQTHGLGMQLGRIELDRIWAELVSCDPWFYGGHYRRTQVLAAKWQGSDAENWAFAESALEAVPPGHPIAAMVAVAHLEAACSCDEGMTAYLAQPHVYASLAGAADKFLAQPSPHIRVPEAHQLFGGAFHAAGDLDRARVHLSALGRTEVESLAWGYSPQAARRFAEARRHVGIRWYRG